MTNGSIHAPNMTDDARITNPIPASMLIPTPATCQYTRELQWRSYYIPSMVEGSHCLITIIMSFMVAGKANEWAQVYTNDHFDIEKGIWNITGMDLFNDMDREFTNVASVMIVHKGIIGNNHGMIAGKYEGRTSAGNFFKEYELLLKDTNYSRNDSHVLTLAENAVDHNLLYNIIKGQTEPFAYYQELKKVVTGADNIRQQWAGQKTGYRYTGWWNANPQRQNHGQSSNQQNQQEPKVALRVEYPTAQQRDATGTTFRGTGRPMDIDQAREKQLCFNCGKPGHMSRNCLHKRKAVVRGIMLNMSEQEHMDFINDLGFPKAPQ
ncbi:hypothetical protein J3R30DRAFT_3694946 [Lentinula aciculospora]|uniref:CCHC-type domain-containing protein n=1 Tax=Lentinula aciculospora TaxID=153920 RepID=A0A9W9DYD0_9AGAR|nr:hypothetical protein J3R30DRAFT_3694946 [Lentinula aciculospora]